MPIEGVNKGVGPVVAAGRSRARAGSAPAFAATPTETAEPALAGAAAGVGVLDLLLGLQEQHGEAVCDRRARSHGEGLLAALARLQRDLLGGTDDTAELDRLTRTMPDAADPGLGALLGAIRLRARVEVAKRQRDESAAEMQPGAPCRLHAAAPPL